VLKVSREGFYDHLRNREKPYKYAFLAAEIRKIIDEDLCNDTYGYPRIHDALVQKADSKADFPTVPCERTVYRIMQHENLTHLQKRKPNGITKEDKAARKSDDLFKRDFYADKPNVKAVTDITEIPCAKGKKLYVSGLFDCFDLYPLGLVMADHMRKEICVDTIKMAAKMHKIRGLQAHSDRGSQYTSKEYRKILKKFGVVQSMNSAGGRCHDNARCEAIWARFKEECLYGRYDTKKMEIGAVKAIVWRYFMSYWANRRICRSIGGIPPAEKRRRYFASCQKQMSA
jgi:transposase InsO family protein